MCHSTILLYHVIVHLFTLFSCLRDSNKPFNLQLVVEKMLAAEGIKRVDLGREEFTKRVWEWKEKYIHSSFFLLFCIFLSLPFTSCMNVCAMRILRSATSFGSLFLLDVSDASLVFVVSLHMVTSTLLF